MSSFATEQTEVLLETVLSLCLRELAVFSELRGKVGVGLLLVSIATASVSITGVTGVAGVALSTVIIFIFIGILSGVCFFVALPLSSERSFLLVVGFSQATSERRSQYWESMDWVREWSSWRVLGLPMRAISSLMQDGSPRYICRWRVVSPHWTRAARWLKSTRYFMMHWLSCILRFSRLASASTSGSWGPKLFFNSPTKSE